MTKGQTMISQEYWAPLQNSLMLLESMLTGDNGTSTNRGGDQSLNVVGTGQESNTLSSANRQILWLVIS